MLLEKRKNNENKKIPGCPPPPPAWAFFKKVSTVVMGGAVAEWSKALLVRENKRKPKDPRFTPRPGQSLKK